HRFLNIGFSQRRAAVTMYLWFATLAGAALATRFIPFHAHGRWNPGAALAAGAIYLLAFASSVYIVYLLEIVKLANPRIRRRARTPSARCSIRRTIASSSSATSRSRTTSCSNSRAGGDPAGAAVDSRAGVGRRRRQVEARDPGLGAQQQEPLRREPEGAAAD